MSTFQTLYSPVQGLASKSGSQSLRLLSSKIETSLFAACKEEVSVEQMQALLASARRELEGHRDEDLLLQAIDGLEQELAAFEPLPDILQNIREVNGLVEAIVEEEELDPGDEGNPLVSLSVRCREALTEYGQRQDWMDYYSFSLVFDFREAEMLYPGKLEQVNFSF